MAENRCDELFGKNGELVEFRKKQVLEGALEIVQRNYEDRPNKMEVIAKLFGKKLNERFTVNIRGTRYEARFLERGFEVIGAENPYVDIDAYVLFDLLAGYAVIVDE